MEDKGFIFKKMANSLFLKRPAKSMKADFGRTLLIGGSRNYPGAILIASHYAAVAGAGYDAIGVPSSIHDAVAALSPLTAIYENFLTDENDVFLTEANDSLLAKRLPLYDSILFGNGVKDDERNYIFLSEIIKRCEGGLVIDATGLNLLAEYGLSALKSKKEGSTIVLTPHLGEAARLFGMNLETRDPLAYEHVGAALAKEAGIYLLLKSHRSLLIDPQGHICPSSYKPTPSLAKAGSGDALAGLLAGLLAYATQKFTVDEVILFADWLFHAAANEAEKAKPAGTISVMEILPHIASVIAAQAKNRKNKEE
jgi:NAD(P)H-hydrate epimerase